MVRYLIVVLSGLTDVIQVEDGEVILCTEMACEEYREPECREYVDEDRSNDDSDQRIANGENETDNDYDVTESEVPDGCVTWFDGCNTCQIEEDGYMACTLMACEEYREPECRVFENESTRDSDSGSEGSKPVEIGNSTGVASSEEIPIDVTLEDGLLSYDGTLQLPTPCHEVEELVTVNEEETIISLEIINPEGGACIQVIDYRDVEGEISISTDYATFEADGVTILEREEVPESQNGEDEEVVENEGFLSRVLSWFGF